MLSLLLIVRTFQWVANLYYVVHTKYHIVHKMGDFTHYVHKPCTVTKWTEWSRGLWWTQRWVY